MKPMKPFEVKIRVRYAETDKMGYVYYGNYATYYEVARTELLRSLGITYRQLEEDGYMLPIASMQIKYIKPAFYDDLLTVRVQLKEPHPVKVDFKYEIYNEKGELLNEGSTLLIFINEKNRKPTKAPEYYMKAVKKLFSDE